MRISLTIWEATISKALKTNIAITEKITNRPFWVISSVSAWLVNVYTKTEIWDISRDFSVDFENIFLS